MFRCSRALVALILIACATPGEATTYQFSFVNQNYGSGTARVVGIIRGLAEDGVSAATSVSITSNPDGFGIGEYVTSPPGSQLNTFTVAGGGIPSPYQFESFGNLNTNPGMACCSLVLLAGFGDALTNDPAHAIPGDSAITWSVLSEVAVVPLPAALPLFASGLGAIGLLAWRRRKREAAASNAT
jgi:hypothetical protein